MLDTILSRVRGPKTPLGVTSIGLRSAKETLELSTPASALRFHQPAAQLEAYSPKSGLRRPGR